MSAINIDSTYTHVFNSGTKRDTLKKFFDYPCERYTVKYGFRLDDGTYSMGIGGCHGLLMNLDSFFGNKRPTHFISCLRAHDYSSAEKYWDKLFASDSPYARLFNELEFHYDKQGNRMAYSHAVTPDTSTQLMANLAIAARFPFESITIFECMMKDFGDLSPDKFIFLMGTLSYYSDLNKEYSLALSGRSHHAFNPTVSLERLRNGPTLSPDLKIGTNSTYVPNNRIWDNEKAVGNSLSHMCTSRRSKRVLLFEKLENAYLNNNKQNTVTVEEIRNVLA